LLGIVGRRGQDDLGVMSFPIHLMARTSPNCATSKCVEICDREPEVGVGEDGKLKQHSGLAAVDSFLRLAVARCRLQVRGDGTTMVLDGEREGRRIR
jgi:hypothetical protein